MTPKYLKSGQMMQHVGMGKGTSCIMTTKPGLVLWSWRGCPSRKQLTALQRGPLTHGSGLNTVLTTGQTGDSGTFWILRGAPLYLPAQGPQFHQHIESILAWNGLSQIKALIVKRLDWGLECETRPSLSSVAITASAFGLCFQDPRGSLSRETSGIFTTSLSKKCRPVSRDPSTASPLRCWKLEARGTFLAPCFTTGYEHVSEKDQQITPLHSADTVQ